MGKGKRERERRRRKHEAKLAASAERPDEDRRRRAAELDGAMPGRDRSKDLIVGADAVRELARIQGEKK